MEKSERTKNNISVFILPSGSEYEEPNKILSKMESDMNSNYDTKEGSMHILTDEEKKVIYDNISIIMRSDFMIYQVDSFYRRMIVDIYTDIHECNSCRYNKRCLRKMINIIREYWVSIDENIKIVE